MTVISFNYSLRSCILLAICSLLSITSSKAGNDNQRKDSIGVENIDLRDKVLLNLYSEKIFDVIYQRKKEKISADETNQKIATYCFHVFILYSGNNSLKEQNKDLVSSYLKLIRRSSSDVIDLKHPAFSDPLNCLGGLSDINAKVKDTITGGTLYPELFLNRDKAGYIELVEQFKIWMALK